MGHPIAFESPRIRRAFVRDSDGTPAAVRGMLDQALVERPMSRATLRALTHDAAVHYLDMTPLLILLAAGLMALRPKPRGSGHYRILGSVRSGRRMMGQRGIYTNRFGGMTHPERVGQRHDTSNTASRQSHS